MDGELASMMEQKWNKLVWELDALLLASACWASLKEIEM
jgi:hypothetical protein